MVNLFRLGFDFLLGWFRVYVGLVSGWLSWGFSRVGGCSLALLSSLSGVGLISITTAVFGVDLRLFRVARQFISDWFGIIFEFKVC